MKQRPVIYQLLPRLFTNLNSELSPNGSIEQNGCGKLLNINTQLLKSIHQLGITHLWLTGVIEHATQTDYSALGIESSNHHVVKGRAGSPYAIRDYYDIDPDLAVDPANRLDEFRTIVDRIHAAGLKVIIDFVPNHVARQYHSDAAPADAPADLGANDRTDYFFEQNNNFYYIPSQQFSPVDIDLGSGADAYVEFPARATGNDCYTAFPGKFDWYETVKLNYGIDPWNGSRHFEPVPQTWHKMLHILLYWASMGVDGFRCDMAHMVPVEFWQWATAQVRAAHPDTIFIAELYDMNIYRDYIERGGFDYLYDKVNLYDTLRAIQTQNHSAAQLTQCWQRLDNLSPHMLNFLENHDEQRFASHFYASDASRAMASMAVACTFGSGAMMIYGGQELGERGMDAEGYSGLDGRTTIFDYWSMPTVRKWLWPSGQPSAKRLSASQRRLRNDYARMLSLINQSQALREGSFFDLMYANLSNPRFNPHRQAAWLRHSGAETLLIAVNFDQTEVNVAINLPSHAFECLNLQPGSYTIVDLFQPDTPPQNVTISADSPLELTIPAYGCRIVQLKNCIV